MSDVALASPPPTNLAYSPSAAGASVTTGGGDDRGGTDDGLSASNGRPGAQVSGGFGPPVATSGGSGH